MTCISRFIPVRRLGALAACGIQAAIGLLVIGLVLGFAPVAQATEPVKISRDDTALDLTARRGLSDFDSCGGGRYCPQD